MFGACRQDGSPSFTQVNDLMLNDSSYFETRGLNYFVFSNKYDAMFDDSKISAVEIIHHGLRTATNGDVRLNPTPGQWDKLPVFINRTVDKAAKRIDVSLEYPQYAFAYTLTGEARDGGFYLSVSADKVLPDSLVGVAGLNMEFFPPVFFGHSYLMDGRPGLFPTSAADNMTVINGIVEPTPMAAGTVIEIAPDAPSKHITIRTTLPDSKLMLLTGATNSKTVLSLCARCCRQANRQDSRMVHTGRNQYPLVAYSHYQLFTSGLSSCTAENGRDRTGQERQAAFGHHALQGQFRRLADGCLIEQTGNMGYVHPL